MRLTGMPLTLAAYPARATTNAQFRSFALGSLDRYFLPPSMTGLVDEAPVEVVTYLEDDNRGAVSPDPIVTLDGLGFHLSIKGVGSAIDPYAARPLDRGAAHDLASDPTVRHRLASPRVATPPAEPERLLTGELWLRGSPYGGQGLEHGSIALGVAERADLTSLAGFRIAPVVKLVHLPPALQDQIRTLHWYRRFPGPMVQEIRLVPSNVRIYFHAKNTLGGDVGHVYDTFGLRTNEQAVAFEVEFVRSTVAMLTLFARTLRRSGTSGRYAGLDFLDVWLDKDAVLAPNGGVYFVDLEGIEEAAVERGDVVEKIVDQVYRSLYEFMFAYEQLEQERARRFGAMGTRKDRLVALVATALRDDPIVRTRTHGRAAEIEIRNALGESDLYTRFPLVDA
jgi:hypothetical protein